VYPADNQLNRFMVSILITLERSEQAKNELVKAIENEPDDPSLHFTLGILYEELEQPDNARESYQSALEVDPNHYESNYNMAVLVFTEANDMYREVSQLGISAADRKKEKEMKPQIQAGFEKALPLWERVHELKPEDDSAVETLAFLYSYLDMPEKAKEMRAKMNE
jgi:tetratricopeptide (TPR) repeat protein